MTIWNVYGSVKGSKYLGEVEAETEEEAQEKAMALDTFSVCLCHQCDSQCEDPEIDEVTVEKASE
jgi:hypothetical protein